MALDCTSRTTLETVMPHFKTEANAGVPRSRVNSENVLSTVPTGLLDALALVRVSIENAAISSDQLHQRGVTEDLTAALKWISAVTERQAAAASGPPGQQQQSDVRDWAMQVVAVVDRLKRSLSDRAHHVITWVQVGVTGPECDQLVFYSGVPCKGPNPSLLGNYAPPCLSYHMDALKYVVLYYS